MSAAPILFLAACLATPADDLERTAGPIEAQLSLDVPDEGVEPGRARVRLDVVVSGPEGLEVTGPRLEDSLAAWRVTRRWSSWREEDGRCVIGLSLMLEQEKPGVVPLPGVVLLAREDGSTAWRELSWPDLLRETRPGDVEPTVKPKPSSWPGRLGVVVLAVAVSLAGLWVARRLGRRQLGVVPPHVRALTFLDEPRVSPARAEVVVREFLDERFGLHTRNQTGRELLAACAGLPTEAKAALEELTLRAELVKFAGVVPDEPERQRAIELARQVISACSVLPVGQEGKPEENGETGAGR